MASRLLLRLAEDINVPARLVGSVGSVVALAVLAEGADLGNLLGSELNLLEVVTDARGGNRLGDDTVSTDLGPGEARCVLAFAMRGIFRNIHDVSGGDFLASALGNRLGDFLHFGAGDQEGNVEHVVTEGLAALAFSR